MIPIWKVNVIQIEITNACHLQCANCTRFVGHHAKTFFMEPDKIRQAIASLDGFQGGIGIMGGEPTIHPRFEEVCKIVQEMIPERRRRELWTAGYKWDEYKDIIHETFDVEKIHYNDHSNPAEGAHQPLLVAIDEVVKDEKLMWKLVDQCWVQQRWSASITTKGAFFCEVAAAQDHMFNGPGGWEVTPGWWKKTPEQFQDQVKRYCKNCSACLPMQIPNNHDNRDLVSAGNAKRLEEAKSPKYLQGFYRIVDTAPLWEYVKHSDGEPGPGGRGAIKSHPEWHPWEYRGEIYHGPGEGHLTWQEVRALQTGKLAYEEAVALNDSRKKRREAEPACQEASRAD